jgi:hypothetical protein
MLQTLTRLPADLSSEARRQLLNAVTDLFLLDQDPTPLAKEHYGEIAKNSLTHLGSEERRSYADNVASVPTLPHTVAMSLANDTDVEVARLVLRLSPVLTDTDLAAIAVSQSQQHLVAIAERVRLSESVTDILVERGGSDVLQTVSSNEGAQFSDKGFDKLLSRGADDAVVTTRLARRSDLAPDRADRVLRIVEQMADTPAVPNSSITEGQSLARTARQQRLEVKLLMADLAAGKRELDEVLIMLAEEDRAFHLAQVIAQAADITSEQALRVLMQKDGRGIAVTCRSLGVGAPAFRSISEFRNRRLFFAAHDLDAVMKDYAKVDMALAERTLRFLKVRSKLG